MLVPTPPLSNMVYGELCICVVLLFASYCVGDRVQNPRQLGSASLAVNKSQECETATSWVRCKHHSLLAGWAESGVRHTVWVSELL